MTQDSLQLKSADGSVTVTVPSEPLDVFDFPLDQPKPAGWHPPKVTDRPLHKLVDAAACDAAYASRVKGVSVYGNDAKRLDAAIQALRAGGEYRALSQVRSDWRVRLDDAEQYFPNFREVIDYLRRLHALAELTDSVLQLDPILLLGPPGVGKTHFSNWLAEEAGTSLAVLRMETEQSSARLVGSAEFWSNTRPGLVWDLLVNGDVANPVVFLDEVDKVSAGKYDPLGPLYALLDPASAAMFSDASYPWVTLDASRIRWICAANDVDGIPAPLLDRMRVFDVDAPTSAETELLARRIFNEVVAQVAPGSSLSITPAALTALAAMPPRQLRRVIREAVGQAVYEGRRRVLPRHIPLETEEVVIRPMGFLG